MHIPDGFLSPQTYGPAYGLAGVLWVTGLRRLRQTLDPAAIPRLAVATAAAFALMMVTFPLPGGSTAHVSGVGMMAVLFGIWNTFLALSLVFVMQAFMLGDGGITALPVSALAMGLLGSAAAVWTHQFLRKFQVTAAVFTAGWMGTVVPAVALALVLGWQPHLAQDAQGEPLFFPFSWQVTFPAVVVPHLFVGLADGLLAVMAWRVLGREESS